MLIFLARQRLLDDALRVTGSFRVRGGKADLMTCDWKNAERDSILDAKPLESARFALKLQQIN